MCCHGGVASRILVCLIWKRTTPYGEECFLAELPFMGAVNADRWGTCSTWIFGKVYSFCPQHSTPWTHTARIQFSLHSIPDVSLWVETVTASSRGRAAQPITSDEPSSAWGPQRSDRRLARPPGPGKKNWRLSRCRWKLCRVVIRFPCRLKTELPLSPAPFSSRTTRQPAPFNTRPISLLDHPVRTQHRHNGEFPDPVSLSPTKRQTGSGASLRELLHRASSFGAGSMQPPRVAFGQ